MSQEHLTLNPEVVDLGPTRQFLKFCAHWEIKVCLGPASLYLVKTYPKNNNVLFLCPVPLAGALLTEHVSSLSGGGPLTGCGLAGLFLDLLCFTFLISKVLLSYKKHIPKNRN